MFPDFLPPEKNAATADGTVARNLLDTEFSVRTIACSLSEIELRGDGTVSIGVQSIPFTQAFLELIAGDIGMPSAYWRSIDFDLFKKNFDTLKIVKDHSAQVCVVSDRAVGLAGGEYRPARSIDVMDAIESINENFWTFQKSVLTDNFFQMDWISTEINAEPRVGDEIKVGFASPTLKTGDYGLKASVYSYRLACANGAVMCDTLGTQRWNYDGRMTYGTSIAKFARGVIGLRDGQRQLTRIYASAVERPILEEDLVRLWRRTRSVGKLTPELTDMALGIDADERHRLHGSVAERRTAGLPEQPSSLPLYSVHNSITHAAKALPPLLRSRLERIGGEVLSFHPSLN